MAVTHNTAATAEQTSMAPRCPLGYLTASHANLVVAKLWLIEVGWGLGSTNSTPDLIHLVAHMLWCRAAVVHMLSWHLCLGDATVCLGL